MSRLIAAVIFLACSQTHASTFTVTRSDDTYPTGQTGQLRWAIQQSNKTNGPNQILFNIPGTGPFIITPTQDLDAITTPVTINGYSQPGASANTQTTGSNATLLIVINGNNYREGNAQSGTGNGLLFTQGSANSVVKGLVFTNWIGSGIFVYGVNDISILGNFIGTNPAGSTQMANQAGIVIENSTGTVIGTSNVADRNIIAGSFFYFNSSACISTTNDTATKIQNNYIGLNQAGTQTLGNSLAGITCAGSTGNVIGSSTRSDTQSGNVISGHVMFGVSLEGSTGCTVQNNYIGTDVTGTQALGNTNFGVALSANAAANTGNNNTVTNNVISANNVGIKVGFASGFGSSQNTVSNNVIGTDTTGTQALGNNYGVIVNDSSNTISGNTISANTVGGLLVYGSLAHSNTITNNLIGLTSDGSTALPNGYGIQLGLLGRSGAAGTNTITTNQFGGSNTMTTV